MHVIIFICCFLAFLQDRDSYWKMMQKYVGSDVTSMVTLPVLIFEPMSMLQKMAEVCFIRLLLVITFILCNFMKRLMALYGHS